MLHQELSYTRIYYYYIFSSSATMECLKVSGRYVATGAYKTKFGYKEKRKTASTQIQTVNLKPFFLLHQFSLPFFSKERNLPVDKHS